MGSIDRVEEPLCKAELIHPAHTSAASGREHNEGIFCSQGVKENWEGEGISEETQNKTAKSQDRDFLETFLYYIDYYRTCTSSDDLEKCLELSFLEAGFREM